MNITLVDSELTSQIDFSAQLELNMSVASCQLIGKTWRINSVLKGLQVTLYYGVMAISIFTFLLYISVSSTFHC